MMLCPLAIVPTLQRGNASGDAPASRQACFVGDLRRLEGWFGGDV